MKPQTHKEELQQKNRLVTVSRKITGGGGVCMCVGGWLGGGGGRGSLNQFSSREISSLILMQLQIINLLLVRIGVLHFIR